MFLNLAIQIACQFREQLNSRTNLARTLLTQMQIPVVLGKSLSWTKALCISLENEMPAEKKVAKAKKNTSTKVAKTTKGTAARKSKAKKKEN